MTKHTIIDFTFEDENQEERTYYVVSPEWCPPEPQTHDEPGNPGYAFWDRVVLRSDGAGPDLTLNVLTPWSRALFIKTSEVVESACTE